MSSQSGKGDKPRSCFSKNYKNNYSQINWKANKKFDKKSKIAHVGFRETEIDKKSYPNSKKSMPREQGDAV